MKHYTKKIQNFLTLGVILSTSIFIMNSCIDCLQIVSGTVLDKQTMKPAHNVRVSVEDNDYNHYYTDESGNFEIRNITGGFLGCSTVSLIMKKDGYEQLLIEIKNGEYEIIYLIKEN